MFRQRQGHIEVLLVHPGGPFWKARDAGAWSIPKGELAAGEDTRTTAWREFKEETGIDVPGALIDLGDIRQSGGKIVHAFAVKGDCDPSRVHSNAFKMEWPPQSGRMQSFPEVDRAEWFSLPEARKRINKSQLALLDRLEQSLRGHRPTQTKN